jgi:hypothetical protein
MTVEIIDSFLTREQCLRVTNYLDTISEPNQKEGYLVALGFPTSNDAANVSMENPVLSFNSDEEHNYTSKIVTQLILDIKQKIEDTFDEKLSLVNCNYVQMLTGASNTLHADMAHLDGRPYHDGEELEYSALVYLNEFDIDYTGGEIIFPLQKITIGPKTGMAVFFRGDVQHPHQVLRVKSGNRKNIVLFFAKDGNTSDRKLFNDEHAGVFE